MSRTLFTALLYAWLALGASAGWDKAREIAILARSADSPLPEGWSLASACTQDDGKRRVFPSYGPLSVQHNFLAKNTPNTCLATCATNGYGYAAVRGGTEVRSRYLYPRHEGRLTLVLQQCWCSVAEPVLNHKRGAK